MFKCVTHMITLTTLIVIQHLSPPKMATSHSQHMLVMNISSGNRNRKTQWEELKGKEKTTLQYK